MANTILHKRSSTQGAVPLLANLSLGELSINTWDGRLYTKKNDGSAAIVDLTQNDKITLDGDATGTSTNPSPGSGYSNLTVALSSTGVVAGNYGSATSIPTIVVDSKGRVTSVTTNAISTSFSLAGGSGTGSVSGGGTLTVNGTSNQITTAVSGSTITIALATDVTAPGNLTVTGNLFVSGTTTSVNSTTVDVADLNLTLAKGAGSAAAANGGGLTIDGANATWQYTSSTDSWDSNKLVVATSGYFSNSTSSTNTTSGALRVVGGAGIGGNLNVGGNISLPVNGYGTVNLAQALIDLNIYSVSGSSGAGNLTIVGNVINLTASGPGAVTTGSAGYIPVITTDVYGRVASIANTAVSIPFSSITSTPTTLSGYGITDALSTSSTIDGGTY